MIYAEYIRRYGLPDAAPTRPDLAPDPPERERLPATARDRSEPRRADPQRDWYAEAQALRRLGIALGL